jgi:hypothetical protein
MRCFFRGPLRDTRGSNEVETALAMLVTIPMLICLFEMCMFCYTVAVLQYASRQGVQYAMTHGTDAPNCSGPGGSVHSSCPDVAGANVTAVVMAVAGSSGHTLTSEPDSTDLGQQHQQSWQPRHGAGPVPVQDLFPCAVPRANHQRHGHGSDRLLGCVAALPTSASPGRGRLPKQISGKSLNVDLPF